MPVIRDWKVIEGKRGTAYPARFAAPLDGRIRRALTEALGLTQFGANVTTLEPGAMSSQRHWHAAEDELVIVIEGEVVLITDAGEQILGPGMVAGFPKGDGDGHHLVNRSASPATYLEVGTRSLEDDVTYPDIDMVGAKRGGPIRFTRRNGEAFE